MRKWWADGWEGASRYLTAKGGMSRAGFFYIYFLMRSRFEFARRQERLSYTIFRHKLRFCGMAHRYFSLIRDLMGYLEFIETPVEEVIRPTAMCAMERTRWESHQRAAELKAQAALSEIFGLLIELNLDEHSPYWPIVAEPHRFGPNRFPFFTISRTRESRTQA